MDAIGTLRFQAIVAAVVAAPLAAGCFAPNAFTCGKDLICPAWTTCDEMNGTCVMAEEKEPCAGHDEAGDCTLGGAPGKCRSGVCRLPKCGNRVRDPGESCDGPDLGGTTCAYLRFSGETTGLRCNSSCMLDTSGCGGGATGTGGMGGMGGPQLRPENLISDFEDPTAATVVMAGNPTRNGSWYTYNDDNDPMAADPSCVQTPRAPHQLAPGQMPDPYVGEAPPSAHPGSTGALALHAKWSGCTIWGAGIGASLSWQPRPDAGAYIGNQVAYDVGPFAGVTFWAMAGLGGDTMLRIKFPMTDDTAVIYDGDCVESPDHRCFDDWGETFSLPEDGSWKQFTIRWTDPTFVQDGWGAAFPWNPAHVLAIQIQSQGTELGLPFDFWIDDLYFFTEDSVEPPTD